MTKWAEAKAVAKVKEHVVLDFLFEGIFSRYGTPREIFLDGGEKFTSHKTTKLMQKYGVKHRVKSPYHP